MNTRPLLLAGCALVAACSSDTPQQVQGTHRIVASLSVADASAEHPLTRALEQHAAVAAVFAHDEMLASGAAAACAAAKRTDVKIIGNVASAGAARQLVADGKLAATCTSTTAAAAAIEVALLACSGITVPKELGLGVTWFSAANLAAGGAHEVAPGDLALDAQRRQHAATLTTTPATDMVFRIGLVDAGDAAPGGNPLREELTAAAKRYPQLQLVAARPQANAADQEAAARDFIARNVNGLLVVPSAPGALAKVCAEAAALNIKVVVLGAPVGGDDFLCHVGVDAGALGRAAAAAIAQLQPRGGDVVELKQDDGAAAAAIHDAFARALGPKAR